MTEFDVLQSAASGMEAQRAALDFAAHNVAAAEVGGLGERFTRLVPKFEIAAASGDFEAQLADEFEPAGVAPAVRLTGLDRAATSDADAITEMVAVLNAQRAFEANASVFDLGKRLAERTVELGR